jgi:hypothetical protein
MSILHSQIITQVKQADPSRDYVVSNVWHNVEDTAIWDPSTDYQNHANEIRDLFSGQASGSGSSFTLYVPRGITVKVYEWTDPKPRLPRAIATYTPTSWGTPSLAPREVACCLSFYATNPSIKTQRGRIYIGPWNMSQLAEFVPTAELNMVLDLGHGLFDIGGENVKHVVHSRKLGSDATVQHYWVNDLWDTMRSRETREGNRVHLTP